MPRITITDTQMEQLEASGAAEILFRDAAQDEFGVAFSHTRSNQLVAKVSRYYRHTSFGFEEIPAEDIREVLI